MTEVCVVCSQDAEAQRGCTIRLDLAFRFSLSNSRVTVLLPHQAVFRHVCVSWWAGGRELLGARRREQIRELEAAGERDLGSPGRKRLRVLVQRRGVLGSREARITPLLALWLRGRCWAGEEAEKRGSVQVVLLRGEMLLMGETRALRASSHGSLAARLYTLCCECSIYSLFCIE